MGISTALKTHSYAGDFLHSCSQPFPRRVLTMACRGQECICSGITTISTLPDILCADARAFPPPPPPPGALQTQRWGS